MDINLQPEFEAFPKTPNRYAPIHSSLASQLLNSSVLLTRYANSLEIHSTGLERDDIRENHLKSIVDAVIYSATALKAEITDIIYYGPGYHLSPPLLDIAACDVLWTLYHFTYKTLPTLQKYDRVLHLLHKPIIDKTGQIYKNATLLIELSEAVTSYKSTWGSARDRHRLFERLQPFRLAQVPMGVRHTSFFPDSSLGHWCVKTAVDYINAFYVRLELLSPLRPDANGFTS